MSQTDEVPRCRTRGHAPEHVQRNAWAGFDRSPDEPWRDRVELRFEGHRKGFTRSDLIARPGVAVEHARGKILEFVDRAHEPLRAEKSDYEVEEAWRQGSWPDRERGMQQHLKRQRHARMRGQGMRRAENDAHRLLAQTGALHTLDEDRTTRQTDVEASGVDRGDALRLPHLAHLQM